MLPISLGMAWLLLGPLCLWLLVKGSNPERAGAVATLALLEAGTIAMSVLPHPAVPATRPAAAHTLRAPPARSAAPRPRSGSTPKQAGPHSRSATPMPGSCDERAQVPRLAREQPGGSLLLSWPATPHECDRAVVALRTRDRKLLIWLRTTRHAARQQTRPGVLTLPVHVRSGTASLTVPLHGKTRYTATDGRSGHRIPRSAA
ncbi:unnamed protein product [[Actinomadura] parvosata subsp. kistnae]|uniref:Uncharacterized protein n=1 Tax=[Actinomadura] parvosata subsp. kistnae TaxID=1909395 RepID=A0A1V0A7P9_9ACTN|nr:hypothetical protein [Nonomuraea sp. ATCC 55076]AQZ66172.1 hypothetical protein BKM31_36165 [Nonomuraea sp. ATCC 55076]SPL97677.1 unnamed protein product [Actinomadura parvosata subsp. kistnae]